MVLSDSRQCFCCCLFLFLLLFVQLRFFFSLFLLQILYCFIQLLFSLVLPYLCSFLWLCFFGSVSASLCPSCVYTDDVCLCICLCVCCYPGLLGWPFIFERRQQLTDPPNRTFFFFASQMKFIWQGCTLEATPIFVLSSNGEDLNLFSLSCDIQQNVAIKGIRYISHSKICLSFKSVVGQILIMKKRTLKIYFEWF